MRRSLTRFPRPMRHPDQNLIIVSAVPSWQCKTSPQNSRPTYRMRFLNSQKWSSFSVNLQFVKAVGKISPRRSAVHSVERLVPLNAIAEESANLLHALHFLGQISSSRRQRSGSGYYNYYHLRFLGGLNTPIQKFDTNVIVVLTVGRLWFLHERQQKT